MEMTEGKMECGGREKQLNSCFHHYCMGVLSLEGHSSIACCKCGIRLSNYYIAALELLTKRYIAKREK